MGNGIVHSRTDSVVLHIIPCESLGRHIRREDDLHPDRTGVVNLKRDSVSQGPTHVGKTLNTMYGYGGPSFTTIINERYPLILFRFRKKP